MSLKLLTLLLVLSVVQVYSDDLCHRAVKLRPNTISRYTYELEFNKRGRNAYQQNISADMYIRNVKTPDVAEVIFKNAKMHCSGDLSTRVCPLHLDRYMSALKFDVRCPNRNEVKMDFQQRKPFNERRSTPEFLHFKWLPFIMTNSVINSLKINATELTTPLTATFEDVQVSGTLKHTFNYANSEMYEVQTTCVNFKSTNSSDETPIFHNPVSFEVNSLIDKNDYSVQELTGKFNFSSRELMIEVKFTFDGHLATEEYKRIFENRSMPIQIEDKADASLSRLMMPEVGFDARWKLVVANLSYNLVNFKSLDEYFNKAIEGDVIVRNMNDPRFVVWKLIPSKDGESEPSQQYLASKDVGLAGFSSFGLLLFDILGDYQAIDLLPVGVLDALSYWAVLDVDALKHLNDTSPHRFKTNLTNEFLSEYFLDISENKHCDLEHTITRNEEEIQVVVKLNKRCEGDVGSWSYKCSQLFRPTDGKLKGISISYSQNDLAKTVINASLTFVETMVAKDNDDLFKVYGEPVGQQWFNPL